MPPSVKTLGLADAMFSLEANAWDGEPLYPSRMEWGYAAWNSSASVNQRCLQHFGGPANGQHCMYGATVAQYIQTPVFALNSKYDTWQEKAIIGAPTTISGCNKTIQDYWVDYGHQMAGNASSLPAQHGAFITNCPAHCQTGTSPWNGTVVGGVTMEDAFGQW